MFCFFPPPQLKELGGEEEESRRDQPVVLCDVKNSPPPLSTDVPEAVARQPGSPPPPVAAPTRLQQGQFRKGGRSLGVSTTVLEARGWSCWRLRGQVLGWGAVEETKNKAHLVKFNIKNLSCELL